LRFCCPSSLSPRRAQQQSSCSATHTEPHSRSGQRRPGCYCCRSEDAPGLRLAGCTAFFRGSRPTIRLLPRPAPRPSVPGPGARDERAGPGRELAGSRQGASRVLCAATQSSGPETDVVVGVNTVARHHHPSPKFPARPPLPLSPGPMPRLSQRPATTDGAGAAGYIVVEGSSCKVSYSRYTNSKSVY
jgi:hypothetical protein